MWPPQSTAIWLNLSRLRQPYHSLAAQILRSDSHDGLLLATMSSVASQSPIFSALLDRHPENLYSKCMWLGVLLKIRKMSHNLTHVVLLKCLSVINSQKTLSCCDLQNNSEPEMFARLLNGTRDGAQCDTRGVTPAPKKEPKQKSKSYLKQKSVTD